MTNLAGKINNLKWRKDVLRNEEQDVYPDAKRVLYNGKLKNHSSENEKIRRKIAKTGYTTPLKRYTNREPLPDIPDHQLDIVGLRWRIHPKTPKSQYKGHFEGLSRLPKQGPLHRYDQICKKWILDEAWVEMNFEANYVKAVKDYGLRNHGERSHEVSRLPNSVKWIQVPPGDSKPEEISQPPIRLRKKQKVMPFQQKEAKTCLLDGFISAIHVLGFECESKALFEMGDQLSQSNINLIQDLIVAINKIFSKYRLVIKAIGQRIEVQELLDINDDFPILALLTNNRGMSGQHAVTILNGSIYDSSATHRLIKCVESLDWSVSSGDNNIVCTGTHRVYQLLPRDPPMSPPKMLRFKSRKYGWVDCLRKGKLKVLFTDGSPFQLFTNMSQLLENVENTY